MSFNKKDEHCDLSNLRYVNNFRLNALNRARVHRIDTLQRLQIVGNFRFTLLQNIKSIIEDPRTFEKLDLSF